jgi:NitT/TauT family transport system substrate-binding protein
VNKRLLVGFSFWLALVVSGWAQGAANTIRVGAFPNITHAQAMIGKANGWFDKAMGPQVKVQWTSFNAGPSAIEALFAGAIDMTYVGPNPAINGYVRSNGEALRVVAGAASGGASLIVRGDSGINKLEDFHGKRVPSPQFGNTQDVALRNWLKNHGVKTNDKGGDVQIVPMANSDQLTSFLKKDLARESAVHRLRTEAGQGLCLALADHRRDALSESRTWPGPNDGTRLERYERCDRRHDSDHRHRLRGGWRRVQRDGASFAE